MPDAESAVHYLAACCNDLSDQLNAAIVVGARFAHVECFEFQRYVQAEVTAMRAARATKEKPTDASS